MNNEEPDRCVLRDAIRTAFPDSYQEIMSDPAAYCEGQLKPGPVWLSLTGCWMFAKWGTWIGVEPDGYVHS